MALSVSNWLSQMVKGAGRWTPYDPSYSSTLGSAQNALRRLHSQYGKNVNRTNVDYTKDLRRTEQGREEAWKDTAISAADRGLDRSGVYFDTKGKVTRDFGKQIQDLTASKNRALEGFASAKASGEWDIRSDVLGATGEARRAAAAHTKQAAAEAAEARHAQAMEAIQRQVAAAQIEAAKAQANAFRGGLGAGGQAFPGGGGPGGPPGAADLWANLAKMDPKEREQWMMWNVHLPAMKKAKELAHWKKYGKKGTKGPQVR